MSINVLKKISIIMCAIIFTLTFIRTDVFAAYSGTTTVTATKTIYFDSGHYIHVRAVSQVDYGYDEGASGWIKECNTQIYIDSETICIDKCQLNYIDDYGKSSYKEKYYIYGYRFITNYSCYVNVYVYCDEWGDVSSWIDYNII